jgi:hypothetical protein
MRVITNNASRLIVDAYELTPAERKDHDYLDWDAIERGDDSASFVRYRGHTYLLNDFSADWGISRGTGLPSELSGWDGYLSDSFFSGIVIRYVPDDHDRVIMGTFLA